VLEAAVDAPVEFPESKEEFEDTCRGLISGRFKFDLGTVLVVGIMKVINRSYTVCEKVLWDSTLFDLILA